MVINLKRDSHHEAAHAVICECLCTGTPDVFVTIVINPTLKTSRSVLWYGDYHVTDLVFDLIETGQTLPDLPIGLPPFLCSSDTVDRINSVLEVTLAGRIADRRLDGKPLSSPVDADRIHQRLLKKDEPWYKLPDEYKAILIAYFLLGGPDSIVEHIRTYNQVIMHPVGEIWQAFEIDPDFTANVSNFLQERQKSACEKVEKYWPAIEQLADALMGLTQDGDGARRMNYDTARSIIRPIIDHIDRVH